MYSGVGEVHRPESLEEALRLLSRVDVPTVPLFVAPRPPETPHPAAAAAVDLSLLGLAVVRLTTGGMALGAAATLEELLKGSISGTPPGTLICEACRTTAHSVLRAVASVGGIVLSGEDSDILLALLVLDAVCVLRGSASREASLAGFSPRFGELLVEVRIPPSRGVLGAALERVARTPRDRSIVAAAAAIEIDSGICTRARLAISGVAPKATRWAAAERLLEGQRVTTEGIAQVAATVEAEARPEGDHLGSAEYRRAVGAVLTRRALTAAWQRAGGGPKI